MTPLKICLGRVCKFWSLAINPIPCHQFVSRFGYFLWKYAVFIEHDRLVVMSAVHISFFYIFIRLTSTGSPSLYAFTNSDSTDSQNC